MGKYPPRVTVYCFLATVALAGCTPPTPTYAPPTLVPLSDVTLAVPPTAPPQTATSAPLTLAPPQTATPTGTATPTPTATFTPIPTPTPVYTDTQGMVHIGTYFSHILNRDMPYRIYLPPGYDSGDRTYPVLYLLHGYPFDESHWDHLGADETADAGIRSGGYSPFIIVMPNCDPSEDGIYVNTSGGDNSVEGLIVNELLPYVEQTYRTWARREGRAIGGISRGGVWSLEIGFRRPDLFAVVGAHSAALSVNYPHPAYDPFNLVADPAVGTLRIWLDAGDSDWTWASTDQLHKVLEEHGIAHEYVIGEGSHEDEYWSRMMPAYMAFYTAGWVGDGE